MFQRFWGPQVPKAKKRFLVKKDISSQYLISQWSKSEGANDVIDPQPVGPPLTLHFRVEPRVAKIRLKIAMKFQTVFGDFRLKCKENGEKSSKSRKFAISLSF